MLQVSCRLTCRSCLFSGLHCRQQMSGKQEKWSRFSVFLRWDIRNHSKVYSASRNTVNSADSPHIPLNVTMNFMLVCLEGFFGLHWVWLFGLVWFDLVKVNAVSVDTVLSPDSSPLPEISPSLLLPFHFYITFHVFFFSVLHI